MRTQENPQTIDREKGIMGGPGGEEKSGVPGDLISDGRRHRREARSNLPEPGGTKCNHRGGNFPKLSWMTKKKPIAL